MSKLPAFQFYPGDWRKDPGVQSLSFHDRGVWFEIICLMHESERRGVLTLNGKAMPEEALARLLGLDNQILTTTLTTLLTFGVASREVGTGALMSRRMVRDEQIRKIRKECGSKGGNPSLVNQIPTTQDNQIPTPSSSSSISSSPSGVAAHVLEPHKFEPGLDAKAKEVMDAYPRFAKDGRQVQGFTLHTQSQVIAAIRKAPEFPWVEAATLEKRNDYPTDFGKWLAMMPDPVWLEAKRSAVPPQTQTGGRKKLKELL